MAVGGKIVGKFYCFGEKSESRCWKFNFRLKKLKSQPIIPKSQSIIFVFRVQKNKLQCLESRNLWAVCGKIVGKFYFFFEKSESRCWKFNYKLKKLKSQSIILKSQSIIFGFRVQKNKLQCIESSNLWALGWKMVGKFYYFGEKSESQCCKFHYKLKKLKS